jgi:polysaccharide biosynthesis transport protein
LNPKVGISAENSFEGYKVRDYVDMVLRRWHWIVISTVALMTMAAVFVWRMPNVYRTEAVILVDPQKIALQASSPTTTNQLADRLGLIRQQVLAHSRLKKLVVDLNLYHDLRGKLSDEAIVDRMEKEIGVDIVEQAGLRLNAFRISYSARDPLIVAKVTNELASQFIEENMKSREQSLYSTSDFIDTELEKTKKDMEEKATELRELKTKYIGALPESQQFHLESLNNLRGQVQSAQDRIMRDQQQKVYLQSLGTTAAPTVDVDSGGGSSYQGQLDKLNSDLAQARSHYGPKHPEVRKLLAQIDDVKKRIKEQEDAGTSKPAIPSSSSGRHSNPVIEAQVAALDRDIAEQSEKQKALQPDISAHMAMLQKIPIFEQKISDMMRDYDTVRTHYTDLLNKKFSADTQISMETRQKGERFVLLDPAPVPDKPQSPKRLLTVLAALVGGIFGGLALVVGLEFADTSVRSRRDAVHIFEQPVLAEVMLLTQPMDNVRLYAKQAIVLAASVVGSAGVGLAASILTARLML